MHLAPMVRGVGGWGLGLLPMRYWGDFEGIVVGWGGVGWLVGMGVVVECWGVAGWPLLGRVAANATGFLVSAAMFR